MTMPRCEKEPVKTISYGLLDSYDYATVSKRTGHIRSCGLKDSYDHATVWKRTNQTESYRLSLYDYATVWKKTYQTKSYGCLMSVMC